MEKIYQEALAYFNRIDLDKIDVLNCSRISQKSSKWNTEKHSHAYMEVIYFLKGQANIHVGNSSLSTSIYDVIAYLPGQIHQETIDLTKDQKVICMGIDIKAEAYTHRNTFKLCDHSGILRWLFEQICIEHGFENKISSHLSKLYAQAIILQFIKYLSANELSSEFAILERIQDYIQQNVSSNITPPQLAAMCNISKSYLHRLFMKHLNTTPVHYINQTRITIAKNLLATTDYSIQKIAHSIGFNDAAYFTRVFKKLAGITPSKFRLSCSLKKLT